jgi:hypothetical protein
MDCQVVKALPFRHQREYATLRGADLEHPADRPVVGSTMCLGGVRTIVWMLGR